MMELSACKIFNQIDKKHYTLYVERYDSRFKIMLLESTKLPLKGEMNTKDMSDFSNELSKSFEEYFEETKKILCGEDNQINFFIKDNTLKWKKNFWTFGEIQLDSVSDIKVICESLQQLLMLYQSIRDKANLLEEENKRLTEVNKELSSKMEKMIEVKTAMEQDLYKKFIIILNSKKKKIKELEDAMKGKQEVRESIFDACTDESEVSGKENETEESDFTISTKVSKRKSCESSNLKNIRKSRKINHVANDEAIHKPSGSKDHGNNKTDMLNDCVKTQKVNTNEKQDCSFENKKSRSSLNFIEDESEEELF